MHFSSLQVDWDVFLPAVVYAYTTGISGTTGDTPWKRASSYVLMPDATMLPSVNLSPSIDFRRQQMISQIQLGRIMAKEHIQWAQAKMKQYYDQHSREHCFQVEQQVWIFSSAV